MTTRTDWVDYAKAIGIILVVYGHVARGLYNGGIAIPEHVYLLADSIVYSFHMPLFFFLSGLFFYSSFVKRGAVGLTFNKIDTIVYPYILWSIFQGSVEVVLSSYTNGNVTWGEVLQLWDPRAQFWFLYALFFIFLVSIALFSTVQYRWLMFIFGFTCLLHLFRAHLPDFKIVLFVANNLVYFVFGVVFTRFNIASHLSSYSAFLIFLVLFITAQYGFHDYLGLTYTHRGIEALVLAITSILFVVSASALLSRTSSKALAFIGASSMAIYLMHILAGSGIRVVLSKFMGINDVVVHLLFGCLAGLLLPLLAVYVINRLNIPYLFSAPVSGLFQLRRRTVRA